MGFDKARHTTDTLKAMSRSFNEATGREKGHPGRIAIMKEDSPKVLYQKLVQALNDTLAERPDYYFEWEERDDMAAVLDFAAAETTILAQVPDKDAPEEAEEEEAEDDDSPAVEEEEDTEDEDDSEEEPEPAAGSKNDAGDSEEPASEGEHSAALYSELLGGPITELESKLGVKTNAA